jgi:sulfate permease, SulP family
LTNLIVPLFGGLPATGVIARTATSIRSGASTPVAGMIHAVFLLGVIVVAAPWAGKIPLAVLAAVLVAVAWRMGEWDEFRELRRRPLSDSLVFGTTFLLTVCFDLSLAVEVGMILAAFLFVKRVADTTQVEAVPASAHPRLAQALPPGVLIYRVFGALLFGAADKLDAVIRRAGTDTTVIILQMDAVTAMDATALERLVHLREKLNRHHRHLILCGPHTQPFFMMEKAGFLDAVGEANVTGDLDAALARAKQLAA